MGKLYGTPYIFPAVNGTVTDIVYMHPYSPLRRPTMPDTASSKFDVRIYTLIIEIALLTSNYLRP